MNLQNGNTFTINAKNNNYNNHYINSLKLNGANYNKTWIDYDDIQKGGNLNFQMNSVPNKEFGISNMSIPYSMTKK
jgi:putative alpha-1,2-mannosidase